MLEIGESLQIDCHKLWQQYIGYKSFFNILPQPRSVEVAGHALTSKLRNVGNAYPLISSILARIAVLPASSAQVERLLSTMKMNEMDEICTEKSSEIQNTRSSDANLY